MGGWTGSGQLGPRSTHQCCQLIKEQMSEKDCRNIVHNAKPDFWFFRTVDSIAILIFCKLILAILKSQKLSNFTIFQKPFLYH